jgi:hypothetical protein
MKQRRIQKPTIGFHHKSTITQTAKNLPIVSSDNVLTGQPHEALQYSADIANNIKQVLSLLNPPLEFRDLRVDDISDFSREHTRFIDVIIQHLRKHDTLLLDPMGYTKIWLPTNKALVEDGLDEYDDLFAGVVTALCLTNDEWRYSTLYKGLDEFKQLDLLTILSTAIAKAALANDLIEFESPVQLFIGGKLINTY